MIPKYDDKGNPIFQLVDGFMKPLNELTIADYEKQYPPRKKSD